MYLPTYHCHACLCYSRDDCFIPESWKRTQSYLIHITIYQVPFTGIAFMCYAPCQKDAWLQPWWVITWSLCWTDHYWTSIGLHQYSTTMTIMCFSGELGRPTLFIKCFNVRCLIWCGKHMPGQPPEMWCHLECIHVAKNVWEIAIMLQYYHK